VHLGKFPMVNHSSKLCYDRQSVGQSVLVSGPHLGLKTRFLLLSDRCGFVDQQCHSHPPSLYSLGTDYKVNTVSINVSDCCVSVVTETCLPNHCLPTINIIMPQYNFYNQLIQTLANSVPYLRHIKEKPARRSILLLCSTCTKCIIGTHNRGVLSLHSLVMLLLPDFD
jgi:hypothetical protein